jgi:hypothetical protein
MSVQIAEFGSVQKGLKELMNATPAFRQNLEARIEDSGLFNNWIDSKTLNLYSHNEKYNKNSFKIDNSFDLNKIVNSEVSSNGSIKVSKNDYTASKGTAFIVFNSNYAIRTDKYKKGMTLQEVKKAGGFKINEQLTPEEVLTHDGWLELAVGKENAAEDDYENALILLKKYVSAAKQNKCFGSGTGMGFYVQTDSKENMARPWGVDNRGNDSGADNRYSFNNGGRFLRVRLDKTAEGRFAKIDPAFAEAYAKMLTGADVLHTPNGDYILAKGKIEVKK